MAKKKKTEAAAKAAHPLSSFHAQSDVVVEGRVVSYSFEPGAQHVVVDVEGASKTVPPVEPIPAPVVRINAGYTGRLVVVPGFLAKTDTDFKVKFRVERVEHDPQLPTLDEIVAADAPTEDDDGAGD